MSSDIQIFFLSPFKIMMNHDEGIYLMGQSDSIVLRIAAVAIRSVAALVCSVFLPFIVFTFAHRGFEAEKKIYERRLSFSGYLERSS